REEKPKGQKGAANWTQNLCIREEFSKQRINGQSKARKLLQTSSRHCR
ncbi:unnamed protein product, partial [Heterosigma akashiwo]